MTLQEIDDALLAWNNRLAAVAANLLELQGDTTYKQLTGSGAGTEAQITGATAVRVNPALAATGGIFEHFTLLNGTIEQAGRKRAALPALFGAEARLREIEQILSGRSILLPAREDDPDGQSLLSGGPAPVGVTPKELLESMTLAFSEVKDAVSAVARAWESAGAEIAAAATHRASLAARWSTLRRAPAPELHEVATAIHVLKARLKTDPLGTQGDLRTRVAPLLSAVEAQLEKAERLRQAMLDGRVRLENLRILHHETAGTRDEVCAKIAGCGELPQPLGEEKLQALGEWLERLDSKRMESSLEAIAVGLGHWVRATELCAAEETAACTAAKRPLEERLELRGRFEALRAKARAYGVAEDDRLRALARTAEEILYTQPADLTEAEGAVVRYEDALTRTEPKAQAAARGGAGRW